MADVFVCYKREDEASAGALVTVLRAAGLDVWWDRDIPASAPWEETIECALHDAKVVAVCWSPAAIASENVRSEARWARENRRLIQIFMRPCTPPLFFGERQGVDLTSWSGDTDDPRITELIATIHSLTGLAIPTAAPPSRAADRRRSVAVLPFANLTGDPTKDYLGDGMAEELILTLSRSPDLRVPARTSTFAYKGRDSDVRQIARDLGVDAVLEGSVRAAGKRIRVAAQLIEVETGFHLWSESYDRLVEDIFELEDELAAAIAAGFRAKLEPASKASENIEAFRFYQQAQALSERPSPASYPAALNLLDRAIATDPGFARAYALRALLVMIGCDTHLLPRSREAESSDDAERAIALDPQLAHAHSIVGAARAERGNWPDAAASCLHGIAINPEEPLCHQARAMCSLLPLGRLGEADLEATRLVELAPAWATAAIVKAMTAHAVGDVASCAHHVDLAVAFGFPATQPPASDLLASIALEEGRIEQSCKFLVSGIAPALREAGAEPISEAVYHVLAGKADTQHALKLIEGVLTRLQSVECGLCGWGAGKVLIQWLLQLGEINRAHNVGELMMQQIEDRDLVDLPNVIQLWWPEMRSFRDDPRFQGIVERLGMIPYWQHYGPPDGYELHDGQLVQL
jgi:TolB-like protein